MLKLNITLSFISFSIQKFRGKSNKTLTKISNFFFYLRISFRAYSMLNCSRTNSFTDLLLDRLICFMFLSCLLEQSLFRLIAITSFAVIGRIRFEKSSTVSDSAIFLKSQKLSEFYK